MSHYLVAEVDSHPSNRFQLWDKPLPSPHVSTADYPSDYSSEPQVKVYSATGSLIRAMRVCIPQLFT